MVFCRTHTDILGVHLADPMDRHETELTPFHNDSFRDVDYVSVLGDIQDALCERRYQVSDQYPL